VKRIVKARIEENEAVRLAEVATSARMSRSGGTPRRMPPWAIDVAIALILAGAIVTAIGLAVEPDAQPPDVWAYALGIAIAALAVFRRRAPLPVLLASLTLLTVYYFFNYPGISAAIPLSVALATAMAGGYQRWAIGIVVWFVIAPVVFRLFVDPTRPLVVFGDVLSDAVLFGAVLVLGDAIRSRRALDAEHRLLMAERERSERLLRNVLPDPIAERLKETSEPIAEAHPEVTVLFADLAGFTELSEGMDPAAIVKMLDDLFSRFDALARERGIEKIKTIGDAYMVAAGVPLARPDHAEAVADMALAMLDEVGRARSPEGSMLGIRIGIDSGPVVAGVIGREKFSYDLWGDTVNTASRMASSGVTGGIQVTARTYRRLEGSFRFERRGMIPVKGKGEMETYLLRGRLRTGGPG
jgi:class 3 adenylate cyclase